MRHATGELANRLHLLRLPQLLLRLQKLGGPFADETLELLA